jgi:hypothetical protein
LSQINAPMRRKQSLQVLDRDEQVTQRQSIWRSQVYAGPAEACSSDSISDFAESGFVR